jgi:phosphoserine phosphatase
MNLVIQGGPLSGRERDELVALTRARRVESGGENVLWLIEAARHEDLAPWCQARGVDFGFVPDGRRLSDMGLFVTDMDSTLITIECIDEIADMQGLKPQVARITEAAMRGEMDFSESLRRRVSLLAGLDESALSRVYDERLALSPGAERLLEHLKTQGLTTVLVSGGFTFFTEKLRARLGFDHAYANTLEVINGKLTGKVLGEIVDADTKREVLLRHKEELRLTREQIIAAGDGANDLKMLAEAAVSVAYRAKPVVRAQAAYALNFCGLDGILNWFEAAR